MKLPHALRRNRNRVPYGPNPGDLFSVRVPISAAEAPPVWRGTHWITALSLCNAFARVVALNGGDSLSLTITKSHKDGTAEPVVCEVSYQFSALKMRRIMTLNPEVTGNGDGEGYVVDMQIS